MQCKTGVVVTLTLLGLQLSCQKTAPATSVLRFTAIPDDNTTELKEKFTPVAEYLQQQLGVPVEYIPSSDYGASVAMFQNGDIQLAWFGGLTGVQARLAVPGAHALVQGIEDRAYYSYFIANVSTGLQPSDSFPQGIQDLRFTFGSPMSTSGRLMPEYFIQEHTGKSPDEFFSKPYGFSGSHNKTAEQVCSGVFDVGVLNYRVYDRMIAEHKIDASQCRVIWRTPPYADYNFTAHPVLEETYGPGFTDRLKQALLQMTEASLLAGFNRTRLIEAKDEEFDAILEIARKLNLAR